MRRARQLLFIALALSLLVHALVALILHPATADFQNQPEAVTIERRSTTIAVAKPPTPPPRPASTLPPRATNSARPRATAGNVSAGGGGKSKETPPPATPAPPAASAKPGGACPAPDAGAAVVASPEPPQIAAATRTSATSGLALVDVQLDAQGQVLGTTVAQSTGSSSLDLAAVSMARDARYSAALHDCKPVAGIYRFSVKFVAW